MRTLKDGSVRYRVIIRQKGHKTETATFRRKTDAKEWAKTTEAAMLENRHFKSRATRKHTLKELIDKYVKEVMPHKSQNAQQQAMQLLWWKEQIGYISLADLTPKVIAQHRDVLFRTPVSPDRQRTPATVNRYLAALSHALSIAVNEWGFMQENPIRKVRKLPEGAGRTRFLSEEEITHLLNVCKSSKCHVLYTIVVLALSTGARKMEILGLHWRNIDLKREQITLEKTKNRDVRTIPLKGLGLVLLKEMRRVRRLDTDLVFPGNNPKSPIEFRKHWLKALENAQISNFRFHDLRHTAASYLAMNGATLIEISDILGHKTMAMVKRYAHLTDSHTSKIVEKMNQSILG